MVTKYEAAMLIARELPVTIDGRSCRPAMVEMAQHYQDRYLSHPNEPFGETAMWARAQWVASILMQIDGLPAEKESQAARAD